MCDAIARIPLEAGVITAQCTMEHEGPAHYDSAFSVAWQEYYEQTDPG